MIEPGIVALRREMKKQGLDAYLLPGGDPHGNEYPPSCWQRRRYISGFTGSAGEVVVTETVAALFTDGRYHLQAEKELDSGSFTLFKSGLPEVPTPERWLADSLPRGARIGVDARLLTEQKFKLYEKRLSQSGKSLCSLEENLVDRVWQDRPSLPARPIRLHDPALAGEQTRSKLERLRAVMVEQGAAALVITRLEDLAWLFNLRGSDVDYSPVFLGWAVIEQERATLYVGAGKIDGTLRATLLEDLNLASYGDFPAGLKTLAEAGSKVWIDPQSCSHWVVEQLKPGAVLLLRPCPAARLKAVKNAQEIAGMTAAHLRDGVAWVKLLKWIDGGLAEDSLSERGVAEQLENFRKQDPLYRGPSFESIVGFKEHAAMVHYSPSLESDRAVRGSGILLIDAGAQYLDGTTDVTRSIAVGEPTEEQRRMFTLVAKGQINLTSQPFPEGTHGVQLDTLARCSLWKQGFDFSHGVGHGVGAYLNVHEEPVTLSASRTKGVPLGAGMICSIEPGFYRAGAFGIRIENIVVTQKAENLPEEPKPFLRFHTLTRVPMDGQLLERSLLSKDEIDWIENYHQKVREDLKPLLSQQENHWLAHYTQLS